MYNLGGVLVGVIMDENYLKRIKNATLIFPTYNEIAIVFCKENKGSFEISKKITTRNSFNMKRDVSLELKDYLDKKVIFFPLKKEIEYINFEILLEERDEIEFQFHTKEIIKEENGYRRDVSGPSHGIIKAYEFNSFDESDSKSIKRHFNHYIFKKDKKRIGRYLY